MFTYDGYLRSDEGGKQMIMRRMFEEHAYMKLSIEILAKKLEDLAHPNNIPEPLRVMGRRAVKPYIKSVKSEENIS